jgi:hypothetical protein
MSERKNPKDPLIKAGPEAQRELFNRFSAVAAQGFTTDDAICAAMNIIINAVRQKSATWPEAERAYDEMFGRSKQVLANHYDSLGRKKGIFPYDQTITVDLIKFKQRF